MAICLSVFGLAVSALAFGAATRNVPGTTRSDVRLDTRVDEVLATLPDRFFARDTATAGPGPARSVVGPRVPIEVLLAQIERHVRLEQAAAESFIAYPTAANLHSRTISPLLH